MLPTKGVSMTTQGTSPFEDLIFIMQMMVVLWIYLPGFLVNTFAMMWGKWFPKTGYGPWPIDGGRTHKDGNRILGDGKTWNGLIGGSFTSGILCMLMGLLVGVLNSAPFFNPIDESGWYFFAGGAIGAFILGTLLGFTSLLGDLSGSYIKRRRGMKREGDTSSKAPLLDTLPFAISVFVFGLILFPGTLHSDIQIIPAMIGIIVITPILHRSFNLIGYKLGWKDVPY